VERPAKLLKTLMSAAPDNYLQGAAKNHDVRSQFILGNWLNLMALGRRRGTTNIDWGQSLHAFYCNTAGFPDLSMP
jgi:hypothetical protein